MARRPPGPQGRRAHLPRKPIMKQIKAFVHRNRVSDLIHELDAAGFRRLSVFDVKGLLRALSSREQQYSVEFGDKVISEIQMELFCEDNEVELAVDIRSEEHTSELQSLMRI